MSFGTPASGHPLLTRPALTEATLRRRSDERRFEDRRHTFLSLSATMQTFLSVPDRRLERGPTTARPGGTSTEQTAVSQGARSARTHRPGSVLAGNGRPVARRPAIPGKALTTIQTILSPIIHVQTNSSSRPGRPPDLSRGERDASLMASGLLVSVAP